MGWLIVTAFTFGIYGSLLHPIIGLISFFTFSLMAFFRQKERIAQDNADTERKKRVEENERWARQRDLNSFENSLRERLNERLGDVRNTFRTTARTSPMGQRDYKRFDREIIRFLESGLTASDVDACQRNGTSLREVYDRSISGELHIVMESNQISQARAEFPLYGGSPVEFERHCAQLFRSCGWHVTETPASGDHGVDLIVSRNGDSIAVQCKLYKQPVGNSAVQEVAAGRMHYGANAAVVVATNGYTSGAEVLARSNSVRLIHPDDIKSLYGLLATTTAKQTSGRHLDWHPKKWTGD